MRDATNRSPTGTERKNARPTATVHNAPKSGTIAPASTTLAAWTRRLVQVASPADCAALPAESDARLPYGTAIAIWERVAAGHPDPDLGLTFAKGTTAAHLGVTGYLASTAETLGGALDRVQRFHRLLKDPSELSITLGPDAVRIVEAPPPGEPPYPRHLAEASLSVAEVAFVLGFSDTSGFSRAFRRWTGHAPRRGSLT